MTIPAGWRATRYINKKSSVIYSEFLDVWQAFSAKKGAFLLDEHKRIIHFPTAADAIAALENEERK